jgi:hypothetical protein
VTSSGFHGCDFSVAIICLRFFQTLVFLLPLFPTDECCNKIIKLEISDNRKIKNIAAIKMVHSTYANILKNRYKEVRKNVGIG